MQFYWHWRTIPELQDLPDDQQRRLWRDSHREAIHQPRIWIGYGLRGLLLTRMVLLFLGFPAPPLLIPAGVMAWFNPPMVLLLLVWVLGAALAWFLVIVLPMQLILWAMRPVVAARRAAMETHSAVVHGAGCP